MTFRFAAFPKRLCPRPFSRGPQEGARANQPMHSVRSEPWWQLGSAGPARRLTAWNIT